MYRFNAFKERIDKQTLYSAMFSINYFKGFSIMRSNNVEETAIIACNMVYKLVGGLKAGKNGFYNNNIATNKNSDDIASGDQNNIDAVVKEVSASEKDYCSVIKKVKKDNITPDNIGEIMLCQIPGISSASALAILAQFKTLPNLIQCLKADEQCLHNICSTDVNGKSRKISKTAIATVVKFLKV
jgi:ERCC4-type nuclease